jgi:hypothetical protein
LENDKKNDDNENNKSLFHTSEQLIVHDVISNVYFRPPISDTISKSASKIKNINHFQVYK